MPTPYETQFGRYSGSLYFHDYDEIPTHIKLHPHYDGLRWREMYMRLSQDDGSNNPYFIIRYPDSVEDLVCVNLTTTPLYTIPVPVPNCSLPDFEPEPEPEPENDIMAITRRFF